jgi:serine/threonine protein kinase
MNEENTIVLKPGAGFIHSAGSENHGQEPLPAGSQLGEFEIRSVLGTGGFGIVYLAWDSALERQVALKEYFPATLAQRNQQGGVELRNPCHSESYRAGLASFVNEARLLAQFDHPALLKVYRFWEAEGTAYMVMPFYKGPTLTQYMARHPAPLPQALLLTWLEALAGALGVMHEQQCFHRDVSPENILVQEETGQPVLLDFGAARRAIGGAAHAFTVILKTSYAPIEQYAELPSLAQGPWTDVYALAAVAHFLVTGRTPPPAVGRMVCDNYVSLSGHADLPYASHVLHAIDSALQIQPQDRTQSMDQFQRQLTGGIVAKTAPVAARTNRGLHAATIFAGLGLMLGAWLSGIMVESEGDPAPVSSPRQTAVPTRESVSETSAEAVTPLFLDVLTRADGQLRIQTMASVLKIGEYLPDFQVQAPWDGYVAVYLLSSDNSLVRLWPNSRIPVLKIKAFQTLSLPPPDDPVQAAGPKGVNQFLVLVTEQVRDYSHLHTLPADGFHQISGTPGQLEGTSPCADHACSDRLAAAWFAIEEVD